MSYNRIFVVINLPMGRDQLHILIFFFTEKIAVLERQQRRVSTV